MSISAKDKAAGCPLLSMDNGPCSKIPVRITVTEASGASDLTSHQVESATIYLFKKAASGIPNVTAAVWDVIKDFAQNENIAGMIATNNTQTQALVENYLLPSALYPYYHSAMKSNCSHVACDPCEEDEESNKAGLMFITADLAKVEGSERLDHEITQVDISRMERHASRHSEVQARDQLLTASHCSEDSSKHSSHREQIDNSLLQNGQMIDQYFGNTEDGRYPDEGPPQFSWMVVPRDQQDVLTRMSSSIQAGNIPRSIVCHSDEKGFDTCTSCEKRASSEDCLPDDCLGSRCTRCNSGLLTAPSKDISDERKEHAQAESYHSNGSVPSWAFVRLGSLLSGHNNEPSL
ncbi:hypothetical protein ACHAWF_004106 [Thalassiosira exigua]